MKTVKLTIKADESFAKQIKELAKKEKVDKSTMIRKLLVEAVSAKKQVEALMAYKEGKISLWKAAKMAGVSLWEMIDLLVKEGVYLDYGKEELGEDLEPVKRVTGLGGR